MKHTNSTTLAIVIVVVFILVGISAANAAPNLEQSIKAATDAANGATCAAIKPFYWEIGSVREKQAAGSVGGTTYSATTAMDIASSSKWLYGAYVLQTKPALTTDDIAALHLTTGYNSFEPYSCNFRQTVSQCAAAANNAVITASAVGKFSYGGGPHQAHAARSDLAPMKPTELATRVTQALGVPVRYVTPQPPGGAQMTPADFAKFLRRVMLGELRIGTMLGSMAVCTNPRTCITALYTPIPRNQDWFYSLGHWVESDGTFSSAGAFGFYPWISSDRMLYGIVARKGAFGSAWPSAQCGAEIRKAWTTGVVAASPRALFVR